MRTILRKFKSSTSHESNFDTINSQIKSSIFINADNSGVDRALEDYIDVPLPCLESYDPGSTQHENSELSRLPSRTLDVLNK